MLGLRRRWSGDAPGLGEPLGRPYRAYAEYTSASTYAVVDFFAAPGPAPAYYSDCPGNDPASDPELDGTSDAW
jgi:hypothetical protein